ncbi:serine hydrolase domain-containing protein [Stenotrophomonas sp.]|uniref:serine hydrolase domain-containing protein n=1 Tax=Stenotrophomonas sp. TaxID=69392 RepID=UPI002FCA553C
MRARSLRAIVLAALVLPLACLAAPSTAWAPANAQARQFVQRTMQDKGIPGLQIAVVKDGAMVLSEAYGLANVENAVQATPATRFPLNSATKAFTGVAMAQLAQAGRVDLQAPVSRYLPDLPAAWGKVRVRQLLAHTSGLPDILDAQGLLGGGSEQAAWAQVTALPMEAEPGARYRYNQTNYVLLARIITRQAGVPYAQYMARHQFDVVGMPRTTFGDSYDLTADAATIYSWFPRRTDAPGAPARLSHWFYDVSPELWAGAGLLTTADEVGRWLIALSKGQLLKPAGVHRMWQPERLASGADGAWAAGWPVMGTQPSLQVGGIGGARAAFVVYPEQDLAVVVLTNLVGANPQEFIAQVAAFYQSPSATPAAREGDGAPAAPMASPPTGVSRAARPSPAGSPR